MDTDHVKAMKQILTEITIRDTLFQILVGRGNNADIHLNRLMSAHPIELAIGQHTQ